MRLLLPLALLLAACGDPAIGDGQIVCGAAGFCPPGFRCGLDNRCYRNPDGASCGNSVVESGETCDPPSSCPLNCPDDGNACTLESYTGAPGTCDAVCTVSPVETCQNDDSCCPAGCGSVDDNNCSSTCGDGQIDELETCDPPATCPTSCDDGNACTTDILTGSADTCSASCSSSPVSECGEPDGCCPSICTPDSDPDCSDTCGNGEIDEGETCDPPASCPTAASCNDGVACTIDTLTGSAANCNASCTHSPIVSCNSIISDGCCPVGCSANSDSDCSPTCGNGTLETGETCDPPATCPTAASCNDGNACTIDSLVGSAASCNASCTHSTITTCGNADGCCPLGCATTVDPDCSPTCGNGTIETGETCDPPSTCLAIMCNDFNACTYDVKTGSPSTCNVDCSYTPITACVLGDGCCLPWCGTSDPDCTGGCDAGPCPM